ncbi:MarR family winged helix-turn-helix transcriptional regulator [Prosthecomicrobium sp. N25]|uniref:MarR family winged helix-turn-helix transcriptional regulator n=1 Tax=Prosthecomicrobium sp. N25 TaxID=3129254 RepID=UPI0030782B01
MDGDDQIDIEAIVRHEPAGHKIELRLWLRVLSCANMISDEIRRRLRAEFDVTLPRFDLLAQLRREPEGLRLGELSKRMMVTNGNITGLVDRLVEEGLVRREPVPEDRRAAVVRMTPDGEAVFARMAAAHESWLGELFGDVEPKLLAELLKDLEVLKASVVRRRSAPD